MAASRSSLDQTAPYAMLWSAAGVPYFLSRSGYLPRGGTDRSSSHATREPCASMKSAWVTSSPVSAMPTSAPVPSSERSVAVVASTYFAAVSSSVCRGGTTSIGRPGCASANASSR